MKDRFNPYGIEKDYKCKTCFNECYVNEIVFHIMTGIEYRKWSDMLIGDEPIDAISIIFHPVCPKCNDCNMEVIIQSYSNGVSIEECMETGKTCKFGFRIQSLGVYNFQTFNIN